MNHYVDYIHHHHLGVVDIHCTFQDLTTFGIGGKIALVYYPDTMDHFLKFYSYYQQHSFVPLFIIGNGSNVFANDDPYLGIVVCFKKMNIRYILRKNKITIYAGCMMTPIIYELAKKGYGGMEFLSGIPATIGGLVAMNAGAYGKEISDVCMEVLCVNQEGKLITLKNHEIEFEYRSSKILKEHWIILNATFLLEERKERDILDEIHLKTKNRKDKQPLKEKNAGSTFKNTISFSVWKMIDAIGYRGKRIGEAQVSMKHSNFLINLGHATSYDMNQLIHLIQEEVKHKFHISLECEWIFVNF